MRVLSFEKSKVCLGQNFKLNWQIEHSKVSNVAVVKIIELVGSSPNSWEDATKNALAEAAKTIRGIKSVYVKKCNAKVEKDKIVEYRAVVKIAFVVKREP